MFLSFRVGKLQENKSHLYFNKQCITISISMPPIFHEMYMDY